MRHKERNKKFAFIKFITTHLPIPCCSTITRMCFLGGFDDKKQQKSTRLSKYSVLLANMTEETKRMNIPDLDFPNNPLKYLSLALFVCKRLQEFSTLANIGSSLPGRNMYKSASSFSLNLSGSSER